MTNCDLARIINSNEVQSVVLPAKEAPKVQRARKNALKNRSVLGRLCPGAAAQKKIRSLAHKKESVVAKKIAAKKGTRVTKAKKHNKEKKAFFKALQGAYKPKAPVAEEAD